MANCHSSSGAPVGSGRPAAFHSSSQADRLAAHTRSCSIRSADGVRAQRVHLGAGRVVGAA